MFVHDRFDVYLVGRALRRSGVLIALVGGLLGGTPVPVAEAKANPGPSPDSLTASGIAFTLRYGAETAPPGRDRWWARDKAKHVVFSTLWTLSTQYVLVRKAEWSEGDALPVSIASGAAVGLAKELYDASHPRGTASARDLVADAVGIGLAVGIIVL